MNLNYKKLLLNLSENLERCSKAVNFFDNIRLTARNPDTDEEEYYRDQLKFNLESAYNKLILVLDCLHLSSSLEQLQIEFSKFDDLSEVTFISYISELISEPYDLLMQYFDSINKLIEEDSYSEENKSKMKKAKILLSKTSKIIFDSKIEPKSETDVKDRVREVLSYTFPDLVKEIPIPKTAKTYKPDIGIPSISLAIEYKYATTLEEVKTCLDGIFTDVAGYSNSKDWTNFAAVIYLTDNFMTPDQIQEHCKQCGIKDNWDIIPVYGTGSRKTRKEN